MMTVPNPHSSPRSHAEVLRTFGVANIRPLLEKRGFELSSTAPQRWADRDSIPGEYWKTLQDEGVASYEELAAAAETRKTAA